MTSIVVSTHAQAREAFRSRDLRQSLYDAGHRLMTGVIVNLHGDDHVARRRLENRLFRRDTFAWYETEAIPRIIDSVLAPAVAAGGGELLDLARRTMTTLSVVVAGVDVPGTDPDTGLIDPEVLEGFHRLMERLARASTVAHAVGDPTAIIAAGDEAFAEFLERYFEPSRRRRAALIESVARGEMDPEELPRDVLTTLLRHRDDLDIPEDDLRREIAYFPWVGSHSTSGQLVHALHHMFTWIAQHPEDRDRLVTDDELRQRFVHESMRLHPASPVAMRVATADVVLRDGTVIAEGSTVTIHVEQANRDPEVFGESPDTFDPYRHIEPGMARWGLSFGHGAHSCLGRELAGGTEPDGSDDLHLSGTVSLMAAAILAAGARPDPMDPPSLDPNTTRVVWGRYPVRFEPRSR